MYTLAQAKQDSVKSPPHIIKWVEKSFGKFHDPVPYNPEFCKSKHKDGLISDWGPVNYVNPPYSQASKFIKKAYSEYQKGKTVVLLVKTHVLGSKTFSESPGAEIVFFPKPVIFPGFTKTPRFHVCLLLYRAGQTSTKYTFYPN